MDLRRLEHLLALGEERHFGRAADQVHLSQPAFSRSIQALEAELNLRLFDRDTGEVRPTPAGEFLIKRAQRLLFDARSLARDVELFRDSSLGDTSFGAGPLAATLLPEVLTALRGQYPDVSLRVEVSNWQLLLERLQAEDIEFFVADTSELPDDPTLDVRSIGRQYGGLYSRGDHPLSGHVCTVAQVWTYGVAAIRLPQTAKAALVRQLGLPGGSPLVLALECDDIGVLKSVALATDTVLASTDVASRDAIESGALRRLQVRDLPPLYSQMGLVSLHNRTLSPTAQRIIHGIEARAERMNVQHA